MVITINDAKVSEAVECSSLAAGQSVDEFVLSAVQEKLTHIGERRRRPIDWDAIHEIQKRVAAMQTLDNRSDAELLGYNEEGIFER